MTVVTLPPVQVPQEFLLELPEYSLLVPDLSKPVWFGDYYAGKLGIYEAEVEPNDSASEETLSTLGVAVTYVTILSGLPTGDFMTYAHYVREMKVEDICAHLQRTVYDSYTSQIATANTASYVDASKQLH